MRIILLIAFCAGLAGAAEPANDDGAILAALAGASQMRQTASGWTATNPDGSSSFITRTSSGYRISRNGERDVYVTRTRDGFHASRVGSGGEPDRRVTRTSDGFRISATAIRDTIMTKTREGFAGSQTGGPAIRVRRTGDGYSVSGQPVRRPATSAAKAPASPAIERAAAIEKARRSMSRNKSKPR